MTKRKHTVNFINNLIGGNSGKVWLEGLLQLSGYDTYPYGYESTVAALQSNLNEARNEINNSSVNNKAEKIAIIDRISSSPDLIVFNSIATVKQVRLIEVKTCRQKLKKIDGKLHISIPSFKKYKEYWPDSDLVILLHEKLARELWKEEIEVTLSRRVICARVSKIKTSFVGTHEYLNVEDETFVELSEMFALVREIDEDAIKMLTRSLNAVYEHWN